MNIIKKMSPGWLLVGGFATVILIGAILLMLPIARHPGVTVSPVDALFTSTSAVCVTGLIVVDTAGVASMYANDGGIVVTC